MKAPKTGLGLKLDADEVLKAWSDKGSMFTEGGLPELPTYAADVRHSFEFSKKTQVLVVLGIIHEHKLLQILLWDVKYGHKKFYCLQRSYLQQKCKMLVTKHSVYFDRAHLVFQHGAHFFPGQVRLMEPRRLSWTKMKCSISWLTTVGRDLYFPTWRPLLLSFLMKFVPYFLSNWMGIRFLVDLFSDDRMVTLCTIFLFAYSPFETI